MSFASSQKTEDIPKDSHIHRTGEWLTPNHEAIKNYVSDIDNKLDEKRPLEPVVQEFKDLIEKNTDLYLLFNSMFEEIPQKKPYNNDPSGGKQVRSYQHMLKMLNHIILHEPPKWSEVAEEYHTVGLPINAILDWPMGTPSGYAAFLQPRVNQALKKILDHWGTYLTSEASAKHLNDDEEGWFGKTGKAHLTTVANLNGKTNHEFHEMFVCEPEAKHHGYKSWDDFFTRKFKEGMRPIANPDDDNVIANSCESKTYALAHNVKARDRFWAKKQPYSVMDMLAFDDYAEQFVGGTIYQAFLSALSYHRWHSPVTGTIKKGYVVPGTYYSEALFDGLGDPHVHKIDPQGEASCQGYITATATRGIVFIEADNPKIGLMALVYVGMSEVSTCDITVKDGDKVKKGDQLGMFHFGGSTHCVLFRKGVNVSGFPQPGDREENVPVRSKLAVVS